MNSNFKKHSTIINSSIKKSKTNFFPQIQNIISNRVRNRNILEDLSPKKSISKSRNKRNVLLNNNQNIQKLLTKDNEEKIFKLRIANNRKKYFGEDNTLNSKINKVNRKSTSFSKREINLLNNPNSFFYHIFKSSREIDNEIKLNKKETINDKMKKIKKHIKNNERFVFKQLELLKKELNEDEQDKIRGKVISTKTFLDLKIKNNYTKPF